MRGGGAVVPVVRLSGAIGLSTPLRPGLTLASVARPLEKAFTTRRASAVALAINSPGGSPVQSHLIHLRIRQLAAEHKVPVIAFAEDVAASGGYMLACAADEIICDDSTIIGSIGVIGGSFGFAGLMEKLGIERRLYTSGERKAMLDPFLPEKPEDVERLKSVQHDIHEDFIALVKASRGARLTGPENDLFSGEFWTGRKGEPAGRVVAHRRRSQVRAGPSVASRVGVDWSAGAVGVAPPAEASTSVQGRPRRRSRAGESAARLRSGGRSSSPMPCGWDSGTWRLPCQGPHRNGGFDEGVAS